MLVKRIVTNYHSAKRAIFTKVQRLHRFNKSISSSVRNITISGSGGLQCIINHVLSK